MAEYSIGLDLGGTNLRAAAIDRAGHVLDRRDAATNPAAGREAMLGHMVKAISELRDKCGAAGLAGIGIGVPGFILLKEGVIRNSNNLACLEDFPIRAEIERRLGTHVILENDANAAALGEKWMGAGRDVDDLVLLTLGTGAGTGLFRDGEIMPHLELAQHPLHKNDTYNGYVGDAARKEIGRKRWNKRVAHTIEVLHTLLHYNHLFIGGGNASRINLRLPKNVTLVSNDAGIDGGAALWRPGRAPPF